MSLWPRLVRMVRLIMSAVLQITELLLPGFMRM